MRAAAKPVALPRSVRHYDPPALALADAPGVQHHAVNEYEDRYTGTAEALAAAGIAHMSMFPGQPGMPATCVTFRPRAATVSRQLQRACATRESWAYLPGSMTIVRRSRGLFCVRLVVSREEQARRRAAADSRHAQQRAATAQYPTSWPFRALQPADWHRVMSPEDRVAIEGFAMKVLRERGRALYAELLAGEPKPVTLHTAQPSKAVRLALVWSESRAIGRAT